MESPSHQPGAVTGRDIIVSVVFHAILFVQGLVAGPTSVNHTYLVGPQDIDRRSMSERYLYPAVLLARRKCAASPAKTTRGA